MSESFYLHDVPLQEAWSNFAKVLEDAGLWKPVGVEEIPIDRALGRITAEAVWAKISSPHYHSSAMDGFAVRSAATAGATDRAPIDLHIEKDAVYVDTGDPLPDWANAVIPIEQVESLSGEEDGRSWKQIRIRSPFSPWSHVRPMGEDIVATELVLPSGHKLRPVDLGALAGSGNDVVKVRRKPLVAILPTGSELIPIGKIPAPGEIIEYNSLVLASQVEEWGATPTRLPLVPDNVDQILESVREAINKFDLLLINAGSSAGSEDFTAEVVSTLGRLIVHGVAVRPGHPVILGLIESSSADKLSPERSIPVIGVPGYPVSAALTGEIFVAPLLSQWLGIPKTQPDTIQAEITRKVHSSMGDDEFLRVTVGRVGDRIVAAPLSRGAGTITSLVRADGIVRIPSGVQGLQTGEEVTVQLYRSKDEINRTIMVLGSHDLTIDLIAQQLATQSVRVTSANVGSLGGLIALGRGEAHLAGSHLLDPESGEYNLKYIREYLPDLPVTVLAMVEREQGLILRDGNPKGITELSDLGRGDIQFVNRQRGSGTRLLLDYHLDQLGMESAEMQGYDWEEYTHLTVAAAVASGRADCGLGVRGAATALDLDFIPLFDERYDLVIPQVFFEAQLLEPLIGLLNDPSFQELVDEIPGYRASRMGQIIAQIE
jgi:putative molybdopterin biosynthesis protein